MRKGRELELESLEGGRMSRLKCRLGLPVFFCGREVVSESEKERKGEWRVATVPQLKDFQSILSLFDWLLSR